MDLFFQRKLGKEIDSANEKAEQAHDQIGHSQSGVKGSNRIGQDEKARA